MDGVSFTADARFLLLDGINSISPVLGGDSRAANDFPSTVELNNLDLTLAAFAYRTTVSLIHQMRREVITTVNVNTKSRRTRYEIEV